MGVYEDMANDAGYPFGTEENANMASILQEEEARAYEAHRLDALRAEEELMHEQHRSSRMKFTREFLRGLLWGDFEKDQVEVISDEITDTSRWSIHYEMIFKTDGKYFRTHYSRGATECQDESPYEYAADDIECTEVIPVEKTVIVYEDKK